MNILVVTLARPSTILTEDDKSVHVFSCCRDCDLLVLNAGLGDKLIVSNTDNILSSHTPTEENSDAGLHTCFTSFSGSLKKSWVISGN